MSYLLVSLLLFVPLLWGIGAYQRLKALRLRCRSAWAALCALLRERHEHIAPLIDTASGYMKLEQITLQTLGNALAHAQQALPLANALPAAPAAMLNLAHAQTELHDGLARLLHLAPAYPDLQSNTAYQQTRAAIDQLNARIDFAQQTFALAVQAYNTAALQLPARLLRFAPAPHYDCASTQTSLSTGERA